MIKVGGLPWGVGVNPTTNRIYVANRDDNRVSVIDGSTNKVIDSMKVGDSPRDVDVNPATNRIYVANCLDGTLSSLSGK